MEIIRSGNSGETDTLEEVELVGQALGKPVTNTPDTGLKIKRENDERSSHHELKELFGG